MRRRLLTLTLLTATAIPLPALAHHGMGGAVPVTAWQGLASGFAHPVIGADHLAFLLAAGVLTAALPSARAALVLIGFAAAGLAGTLLHLAGIGLGPVELAVAVSVLLAGAALFRRERAALEPLAASLAAAGLFHGHAYAEAVIGAEPAPILAYLIGLAAVQFALAMGAAAAARRLDAGSVAGFGLRLRRFAGAAAAGVGALALFSAAVAV